MNRIHTVLGFFLLASTFACSAAVESTGEQASDLESAKPAAELTAHEVVISATETSQDAPKVAGFAKMKAHAELESEPTGFAKMKPRAELGNELTVAKDPGAPVEQGGLIVQGL